jgi:hypothetical protein
VKVLLSANPKQGNTSMIIRSKMTIFAAAALLSVTVATQVSASEAPYMVGTEIQGGQSCSPAFTNCKPMVVAAAKEDDWTAWGGSMRGIEK